MNCRLLAKIFQDLIATGKGAVSNRSQETDFQGTEYYRKLCLISVVFKCFSKEINKLNALKH